MRATGKEARDGKQDGGRETSKQTAALAYDYDDDSRRSAGIRESDAPDSRCLCGSPLLLTE